MILYISMHRSGGKISMKGNNMFNRYIETFNFNWSGQIFLYKVCNNLFFADNVWQCLFSMPSSTEYVIELLDFYNLLSEKALFMKIYLDFPNNKWSWAHFIILKATYTFLFLWTVLFFFSSGFWYFIVDIRSFTY